LLRSSLQENLLHLLLLLRVVGIMNRARGEKTLLLPRKKFVRQFMIFVIVPEERTFL
jgi:hypothetical protein